MMDDYLHDLLVRGVAAIKAGEKESGRKALERLLDLDASEDDRLDAWWYLSGIEEDAKKVRDYLENILARNPADARARRKLAVLDGKLDAKDIIDPDLERPAAGIAVEGSADRFTCPKCGGRMVFTPDGTRVICEYCANQERKQQPAGFTGEQDFFVAMATKKGHSRQVNTITFDCEGCGSEFILPPGKMSINCPFCGSAYVVRCDDPKTILEPNGVVPFQVGEEKVKAILREWFRIHTPKPPFRVTTGIGIYLPVWSFAIEGPVPYQYQVERNDKKVTIEEEDFLLESGIRVSASSNPPRGWLKEIPAYEDSPVSAFDPGLLANWVAETYQVSIGDASLTARQIALERGKQKIEFNLENGGSDLRVSSAKISVVSYELIMLPVWWIHYHSDGKEFHALVNGVKGSVRDERYDKQNLGQKLFDFVRRGGKTKFLT